MKIPPSTAAQVIVSIIPIVGIVMGSVVAFFFLLWSYKQRVAMIQNGLYKRTPFDIATFSLFTGLILTAIGLSLILFFIIKNGFAYGVLSGLIPFSLGISLLAFFKIKVKLDSENEK